MCKTITNPWSKVPDSIADAVAADRVLLIGEDESLRDVASKQFLLGNGTVMAMVYSYAVHHEKDGKLEVD